MLLLLWLFVCVTQELELALEEERRAAEELRASMTVLERKRIALQTELEDVRGLLEAVSVEPPCTLFNHSVVLCYLHGYSGAETRGRRHPLFSRVRNTMLPLRGQRGNLK